MARARVLRGHRFYVFLRFYVIRGFTRVYGGHMHIFSFYSRRRPKALAALGGERSLIAWRRLCARGI